MKSFHVIGVAVVALVLAVGGVYGYLALYKDVAPQFQAAEREVFENTPSYVQGKIQQLTKLQLDYNRADSAAQKTTLKEMILTEAATVDNTKLPANLQGFVRDLQNNSR